MWKVGVTGGIACGKSTVVAMLREWGTVIIDTDQLAREVVRPGCPAWKDIVNHFGTEVLQSDQTLDRAKLGAIVFNNPAAKSFLEQATHPRIETEISKHLDQAVLQGHNIVIIDVPLLFEVGWNRKVDRVWVVVVEPVIQLNRLMMRDQLSREQAEARIHSQWPLEQKKRLANVVIDNSGSLETTCELVQQAWDEEKKLAAGYFGK